MCPTPNLEYRSVYLCPLVTAVIPPSTGSLSVAFCYSQGYSGCILTILHTGIMNTILIKHPVFRTLTSFMHINMIGTDMNLKSESSDLLQFDFTFIWILKSPSLQVRFMLQERQQSTIISHLSKNMELDTPNILLRMNFLVSLKVPK
jgi:hypothetical protein